MSKTGDMQAKDKRMFGIEVREHVYRGDDDTLTQNSEVGRVDPVDHGVRPLIGKFSTFNLSYLTPKQRKLFLEQFRYELSLSPSELNQYLSQRYSPEDEAEAWRIQAMANKDIRSALRKVGITKVNNQGLKKRISKKKRVPLTEEQRIARAAKAKATRERNKNDPNYVSYGTLKREFIKTQKLLAARHEARMKEATALYVEPTIKRTVKRRLRKYELENQQLKEYLKQNGLPLPGTQAAKMRREQLRAED